MDGMNSEEHMHKAFEVHMLNEQGKAKARKLANAFEGLLAEILDGIGSQGGREHALVVTHLELASFYAKKAMASQPENQEP